VARGEVGEVGLAGEDLVAEVEEARVKTERVRSGPFEVAAGPFDGAACAPAKGPAAVPSSAVRAPSPASSAL